jgi:hypothetical protein
VPRVDQIPVVAYRPLVDVSKSRTGQTSRSEILRIARGARFCCAAPRGMRGFPDAAVACLGAGGGVLSPGTKSNIGRIFSSTLLRSASCLPSGRGIHVPDPVRPARLRPACHQMRLRCTLVFSVSTLYLLVYTLLNLSLKDSSPTRFIVFGNFQDVGSVDPVVCSASHAMIPLAIELVNRYLCNC